MQAGAGFEAGLDPERAAAEACRSALRPLSVPPELLLLFATAAWGGDVARVVAAARDEASGALLLGATVQGLFGAEATAEQLPAVGCLALAGVEAQGFWIDEDARCAEDVAHEIERQLRPLPGPDDFLLVLHGTRNIQVSAVLDGLALAAPRTPRAGVGASPVSRGRTSLWCDDDFGPAAAAGVVLRQPTRVRVAVAQGAQLLEGPHTVTRTNGPWVLELDGEPALDCFRKRAGARLGEDLRRASRHLGVSLGPEPGPDRMKSIVGFDEETRAFSLAEEVATGTRLGFVVRDASAARLDLDRALADSDAGSAAAALYLGCRARGSALFGDVDLEPALLRRALPMPLLGVQGNLQIGPNGPLTHAGVLTLFG